ncbi:MAG TPA: hypothetical protein VNT54_01445 [Solirubrobacteraceae bacterium]|nr:hypothetical protein [Solirubrobacteraceae bacterium]
MTRRRAPADEQAPAPEAAHEATAPATPEAEEDDPFRCPKRWMGKRCTLRAGHVGVCQW